MTHCLRCVCIRHVVEMAGEVLDFVVSVKREDIVLAVAVVSVARSSVNRTGMELPAAAAAGQVPVAPDMGNGRGIVVLRLAGIGCGLLNG